VKAETALLKFPVFSLLTSIFAVKQGKRPEIGSLQTALSAIFLFFSHMMRWRALALSTCGFALFLAVAP